MPPKTVKISFPHGTIEVAVARTFGHFGLNWAVCHRVAYNKETNKPIVSDYYCVTSGAVGLSLPGEFKTVSQAIERAREILDGRGEVIVREFLAQHPIVNPTFAYLDHLSTAGRKGGVGGTGDAKKRGGPEYYRKIAGMRKKKNS